MSTKQEKQLFSVLLIGSLVALFAVWATQTAQLWEISLGWTSISALVVGIFSLISLMLNGAWKYLAGVLLSSGVLLFFYIIPLWLKVVLVILAVSTGLFLFVKYRLAPRNRWFTEVPEARAKFIVKGRQWVDTLMRWSGRTLDENGNVVPVDTPLKDGKPLKSYKEVKEDLSIRTEDLARMERFTLSRADDLKNKLENQGISNMEELEEEADNGRLSQKIDGTGERTEEKILELIEHKKDMVYEPIRKGVKDDGSEPQSPMDADKVITVYEEVDPDSPEVKELEGEDSFFGGLTLYSFLHPLVDVLTYKFTWSSLTPEGEIERHVDKPLDYMWLNKERYPFRVTEAEDGTLLPLGALLTIEMQIINPRKAKFEVRNWLGTTIDLTKPAVRNALSSEEFEQLTGQEEDLSDDIFATVIENGLIDKFKEEYGVKVKEIKVENIDPTEELREATTAKAVASFEADARREEAKGEADAMETLYSKVEEHEPVGMQMKGLEALKESEPTIFGKSVTELIESILSLKQN